ncbi:uncharacterized protein LOC101460682 isoform X2 [Ceratitis capitata]|uniref:uncharacterized protein LOC101460682 isoform X2 n=1 Tax=Ceratitis capitata TaxID=7213 RepID=UPI0006188840|nr:uncharacterized protein LOC101460682 isoform X2 [Ceratitis capitata]
MTFYWWSHWFWITTLSTVLLSITFVQTYPSQEISLEYNQNSKTVKAITKLQQQTTANPAWTATTPAPVAAANTDDGDKEAGIIESIQQERLDDSAESAEEESHSEKVDEQLIPEQPEGELEELAARRQDNIVDDESQHENIPSAEDADYKRSAEGFNKTLAASKEDVDENDDDGSFEEPHVAAVVTEQRSAPLADEQDTEKLKRVEVEMSNYTNHTRSQPDVRTNATAAHELNSTVAQTRPLDAPKTRLNSSTASAVTTKSRLDARHSDTLEWLNAMAAAAALPVPKLLTNMPQATEIDREVVTGPTESAVDTAGAVTTQQRIPFTLENANKEEELRRAENEHRSRKSKVLSAEYKHINRFINYSSDTKSLLTRSASTAPNDFDGGEEGNISSEALSIQRTYFLDAGAISAICFTIFGVCCTMGTIGIVLYRRRYLNKPQALSEPDSSVYIDDSTMRVSDNSDEMYSLDNDSFLNSLEAMTIQNYWTDTVKHTKL